MHYKGLCGLNRARRALRMQQNQAIIPIAYRIGVYDLLKYLWVSVLVRVVTASLQPASHVMLCESAAPVSWQWQASFQTADLVAVTVSSAQLSRLQARVR